MYPVSNEYLNVICENDPVTRITGTLELKDGTTLQITNEDIAKAPSIMNQCVNNSELKLGQAYQAQLDISIYSNIDRYLIYGARIELAFGLQIEDAWEDVPLGVFIVSECIRTSNDVLQITALDEMNKLDEKYSGDLLTGTPFSILSFIATEHGLLLAQTQNEIEALPNGTHTFGSPEKFRSSTWRDVVGDLAACLAGNAIIDRTGKLFIQSFSTSVTRILPAAMRSREQISDYLVSYSSASCVKNDSQISVGTNSGQDIALDNNDFLQLGTPEAVQTLLTNILEAISPLEYTPSDISWFGDPALDLGDLINAIGGTAADSTLIPVQKYKWTWRGDHQIVAVGKNPNLVEVQSLTDKKISETLQATAENEVTYHVFTNLEAITFGSEQEVTLASLAFTSAQTTTVKIMHEFIFDMLRDLGINGSYELRYYLDEELVAYKPKESLSAIEGKVEVPVIPDPESEEEQEETESKPVEFDPVEFSITRDFFYIVRNVMPNQRHTWQVRIITHGIEETTIDVQNAHVVLEGQRLYGEEYFDGFLEIRENIGPVALVGMGVDQDISESIEFEFKDILFGAASDDIQVYEIATIGQKALSDRMQMFIESLNLKRVTEDGYQRITEDGYRRISE